MGDAEIDATIRDERSRLVERLRRVDDAAWQTPSLCRGWTVRHVLAHLVTPFLVNKGSMVWTVVRSRGIAAAMDAKARELAGRPVAELLDVLERNADTRFRPPGGPAAAPLTDIVVHGADITWPLGDDHADRGDPHRLRPMLDFLVSKSARRGLVTSGRLGGVRLIADDIGWEWGSGAEVRGPAMVVGMGILRRSAALDLLSGDGVPVLAR